MKKIVFFSRLSLVHLYAKITPFLENEYEVVHLAYSHREYDILTTEYNITPIGILSDSIKDIKKNINYDELPEISEIDTSFLENTDNIFNLNSALQSDRTLAYETYENALIYARIYYKFWTEFYSKVQCDFLFHEANALLLTQMASVVGKSYNVKYLTMIQGFGNAKYNWLMLEAHSGCSPLLNKYFLDAKNIELDRVKTFLHDFRSNYYVAIPFLKQQQQLKLSYFSFFKIIIKNWLHKLLDKKQVASYNDPIDAFSTRYKKDLFDEILHLYHYYYKIFYDDLSEDDDFYFYPLHMEPEAVVLYWGEGYYKNQVKLIENIAAQLPPSTLLYVKDHPAAGAYRDYIDYKRIQMIPNVKLLHPNISGKTIIAKSKGVITINGTAGLEALLMNKLVYSFGSIYYNCSNRVIHVKHIKDFRQILYDNNDTIYSDDEDLYSFVSAYLNTSKSGFVAYFKDYAQKSGINEVDNAKLVASGIIEDLHFYSLI